MMNAVGNLTVRCVDSTRDVSLRDFLLKNFYGVCLPKTFTGTMGQAEAENALFAAGHMCSDIIE